MRLKIPAIGSAALLAAFLCFPVQATTVLKMSLDDLATRADRVFRGSVVSVEPGSVKVGGGSIQTVTYELLVQEQFKGSFPTAKDQAVVTVTMIGNLKEDGEVVNGMRHLSVLPDLPDLRRGHEYLLFTTRPSAGGLSTTVGLGQGAFKIYISSGREEMAANELNNAGLFNGPVTYTTLASAVRAALAN